MRRGLAPAPSTAPPRRRPPIPAAAPPDPHSPTLDPPPLRPPTPPPAADLPSLVSVARAAVARGGCNASTSAPSRPATPAPRPPSTGDAWRASARGGRGTRDIVVNRALLRAADAATGRREGGTNAPPSVPPSPTLDDVDAFAEAALALLHLDERPRSGGGRAAAGVAPAAAPARASPFNTATALHRLGLLWRAGGWRSPPAPGTAAARLLEAAAADGASSSLAGWRPRSVANALWGLAITLRPRPVGAGAGDRVVLADDPSPPSAAAGAPPPLPAAAASFAGAAMAAFAASPVAAFKPQEAANLAWAAATLGVGGAAEWRGVADAAAASLAASAAAASTVAPSSPAASTTYTPQGIAMLAWALARARYRHEAALDAAAAHAAARVSTYTPQSLATLAWALAVLRHPPPPGLLADAAAALAAAARAGVAVLEVGGGGGVGAGGAQIVCNFCWGAAALGGLDAAGLTAVVTPLEPVLAAEGAPREALHQLWQAARLVEARGGAAAPPTSSPLPPAVAAAAAAARSAALAAPSRATGFANAVYAAFAASPRVATASAEATIARGAHRVDVAAVTAAGTRLAVEADGPPHYLVSHPRVAAGATAVRDALLRRDGWRPLAVPYWEWDALGAGAGAAAARAAYVDRRLNEVEGGGWQKRG